MTLALIKLVLKGLVHRLSHDNIFQFDIDRDVSTSTNKHWKCNKTVLVLEFGYTVVLTYYCNLVTIVKFKWCL